KFRMGCRHLMKIQLPHRTLHIREEHKMMDGEDKVKFVNEILQEEVIINGESMTLDYYFATNFNNQSVIVAMDMLSYFITKIHRERQDIMTRETIKKMQRGDGRTINFSNLKYKDKVNMGMIDDIDDSNYN